jgi:hypothetical protein
MAQKASIKDINKEAFWRGWCKSDFGRTNPTKTPKIIKKSLIF